MPSYMPLINKQGKGSLLISRGRDLEEAMSQSVMTPHLHLSTKCFGLVMVSCSEVLRQLED